MVVDVTGFGWSGSGAVHDLLREYKDVDFKYDGEFTILWSVDGIYDLEEKLCHKHCRFADSNMAIKRFLSLIKAYETEPLLPYHRFFRGNFENICSKYIEDLIQVTFKGHTLYEITLKTKKDFFIDYYNNLEKKLLGNRISKKVFGGDFYRKFQIANKSNLYLSYNPQNFEERTKELMGELFSYLRTDRDLPLITNQMFPPDCPSLFFNYIGEPTKSIIVRRDPRDVYLLAKKTYKSSIPLPIDNVEDFIVFYKKTIEETRLDDSDIILNLNFEDLIYKYEETKLKIESFVGISRHERSKSYFNPSISVNNTQLFKKYKGLEGEIQRIEEELRDSLYPFESCMEIASITDNVF